jgi:hypothetical protein
VGGNHESENALGSECSFVSSWQNHGAGDHVSTVVPAADAEELAAVESPGALDLAVHFSGFLAHGKVEERRR